MLLPCMVQLLYYEADSDLANTMRPSWDEHSYRHVDVVAADRVFADINDAVVNAETRSVAVTQRGVYFAFYDQVTHSLTCTHLLTYLQSLVTLRVVIVASRQSPRAVALPLTNFSFNPVQEENS